VVEWDAHDNSKALYRMPDGRVLTYDQLYEETMQEVQELEKDTPAEDLWVGGEFHFDSYVWESGFEQIPGD
jgi:hypothetical protein